MTRLGALALAFVLELSAPARGAILSESFDDVSALPGAGWVLVNASAPTGISWFQGNPTPFSAQSGAPGSYVAANFLSTGVTGTVDQWLITPEIPLHGGETVTFSTRTSDAGFGDLLRVRLGQGSSAAIANFTVAMRVIGQAPFPYPSSDWSSFTVTVPNISGLTSGRIAFEYSVASAAAADYIGLDSLEIAAANLDPDGDGVLDPTDDCPTIANVDQADADGDGVGDVCDNCTAVSNPRVAASFVLANSWVTMTGGQRDDDHDGYGNLCDAKFPGVSGALVGAGDLVQMRISEGKSRTGDTCGTSGTVPCAIFDLDETSGVVGAGDLARLRLLNGKLPGPKCAACPLPCSAGSNGSCAP